MAYGALVQQAFMSGPPAFGARQPIGVETRVIRDILPPYEFPSKCTVPKKDEFILFAIDPNVETPLRLPLAQKGVVIGSSQDHDGQILNRGKGVCAQHCAVLHNKGKLFLKAIEGDMQIQSISLHSLKDRDGRPAKKYANSKGVTIIDMKGGVSGIHKFTKEMCVFTIGKSPIIYWIDGPLPLGDNEYAPQENTEKKKKEKRARSRSGERREDERKDREDRKDREGRKDREERKDRKDADDRKRDRGERKERRSRSRRRRA